MNVQVRYIRTNGRPQPDPWYTPAVNAARTGGRWFIASCDYAGPHLGWALGRSVRFGCRASWGTTKVLFKLALLLTSFAVIGLVAAAWGAMRLPKELR